MPTPDPWVPAFAGTTVRGVGMTINVNIVHTYGFPLSRE